MTSLTKYEIGFGKEIKGKKSQWGLIKSLDLKYHTIIDNEKKNLWFQTKCGLKLTKIQKEMWQKNDGF